MAFHEFQFHKVRLKERAIEENPDLMMFQFHKVRLKDILNNDSNYRISLFQFHKVRLKGYTEEESEGTDIVSIP